eukprot:3414098-Pyramimonas_sp.AAC.1
MSRNSSHMLVGLWFSFLPTCTRVTSPPPSPPHTSGRAGKCSSQLNSAQHSTAQHSIAHRASLRRQCAG